MPDDMKPPAQIIRIPRGGGEDFDVAGAKLTWKVKSDLTDSRFCFFEQVLAPGDGVPLHIHSHTETFYVLSGAVTFEGPDGATPCETGDVVVARSGSQHGFVNHGRDEARMLSISVAEHQRFFDAVAASNRAHPFADMSPEDMMPRVAAIGAENDCLFVPLDRG